jgi:hypothetical protein
MPNELKDLMSLFEGVRSDAPLLNEIANKKDVETILLPVFSEFEDLLFIQDFERELKDFSSAQKKSFNQLLCLTFSTCGTRDSKQFLINISYLFARGTLVYDLNKMVNRVFSGLQKDNLDSKLQVLLEDMVLIIKEYDAENSSLKDILINILVSLIDLIKRTTDNDQMHVIDKFLIEWVVKNIEQEPLKSGHGILMQALSDSEKKIKVVYPTLFTS